MVSQKPYSEVINMRRYFERWHEDRNGVEIIDRETDYTLNLCQIIEGPFNFAHTCFHSTSNISGLFITTRDIQEYDLDIRDLKINPLHRKWDRIKA